MRLSEIIAERIRMYVSGSLNYWRKGNCWLTIRGMVIRPLGLTNTCGHRRISYNLLIRNYPFGWRRLAILPVSMTWIPRRENLFSWMRKVEGSHCLRQPVWLYLAVTRHWIRNFTAISLRGRVTDGPVPWARPWWRPSGNCLVSINLILFW